MTSCKRLLIAGLVAAAPALALGQETSQPTPAAPEKPLAIAANDSSLQWGPCPAFIPAGCQIAVLHGDPSKPNADVFFKVPGGFKVPNHWHTSAERIVLVTGEMSATYAGHPTVTLKPGMYVYGPAKLAHEVTCTSGDACVVFIAFESPVDAVPVEGEAQQ
jgi:anti-sigma factor ChrR (cupin superfamily)